MTAYIRIDSWAPERNGAYDTDPSFVNEFALSAENIWLPYIKQQLADGCFLEIVKIEKEEPDPFAPFHVRGPSGIGEVLA
jgi:hypothetical protein